MSARAIKESKTSPETLRLLEKALEVSEKMTPIEYASMIAMQQLSGPIFYSVDDVIHGHHLKGGEVTKEDVLRAQDHLEDIRNLIIGKPNRQMATMYWGHVLQFSAEDKEFILQGVEERRGKLQKIKT